MARIKRLTAEELKKVQEEDARKERELLDAWAKDVENADSNLTAPLSGGILCALCYICKNFDIKKTGYIDGHCRLVCNLYGYTPAPIADCDIYECEGFELDEKSCNLKFFYFDENCKPIPKRTKPKPKF